MVELRIKIPLPDQILTAVVTGKQELVLKAELFVPALVDPETDPVRLVKDRVVEDGGTLTVDGRPAQRSVVRGSLDGTAVGAIFSGAILQPPLRADDWTPPPLS